MHHYIFTLQITLPFTNQNFLTNQFCTVASKDFDRRKNSACIARREIITITYVVHIKEKLKYECVLINLNIFLLEIKQRLLRKYCRKTEVRRHKVAFELVNYNT